jgi:hypothetical protein
MIFPIRTRMDYAADMNDDETAVQQLLALKAEHRRLDQQIAALIEEGVIDQLELARLKKRKLRLKDEIERMRDHNVPDIIA